MFNDDDLLDYIDGELSPEQEQDLFSSLAVNPAQRDQLRTHRHIEDGVKDSLEQLAPSAEQKERLFSAINSQAAVNTKVPAGRRSLWGGLLLLGLVSVATVMLTSDWMSDSGASSQELLTSANVNTGAADNAAGNESNVNGLESLKSAEEPADNPYRSLAAGNSEQRHNRNAESNNALSGHANQSRGTANPRSVQNSDLNSAQNSDQNSGPNSGAAAGSRQLQMHSASDENLKANFGANSAGATLKDGNNLDAPTADASASSSAQTVNSQLSPALINLAAALPLGAEELNRPTAAQGAHRDIEYAVTAQQVQSWLSDFSLEFQYAQSLDLPRPTIEPASRAATDQLAGAVLYHGFQAVTLGVEVRSETFFQEFEGRNADGIPVLFEQQPNFVSVALLAERGFLEFAGIDVFGRAALGANRVGTVGRAMLGLRYDLTEQLSVMSGLEGSLLFYNHENLAYQSRKTQVLGMLRYRL